MGWRFRRSVKLFPGVRLNFSGGGISTTIGVPGASINVGKTGSYVNLGLTGTGLSYRAKLMSRERPAPIAPPHVPASPQVLPPVVAPPEGPLPGEIHSGAISEMTSPGLGELKRLINEAAMQRVTLSRSVAESEKRLQETKQRLHNAQRFVVRLFMQKQIPRLADDVHEQGTKLEDERARLNGCEIDIGFAFDDATLNSFAALVRAYEELRQCAAIWDITSSSATNRVAQRTIATDALTRTLVQFDFASSENINSAYKALVLGNTNGEDIHIYPGFVMMRSPGRDFALLDVRDLTVELRLSRFIEEERILEDSEVIDRTWAKTNKDGSPDRRFQGNYQIPVIKYGQLFFRSNTRLQEAYMFSNFERTKAFAAALGEYQMALSALASRSEHGAPPDIQEPLAPFDQAEGGEGENADLKPVLAPDIAKPKTLFFDWAALGVLVLLLIIGGYGAATGIVAVGNIPTAGSVAPASLSAAAPAPAKLAAAQSSAHVQSSPTAMREVVFVQGNGANVRAEPSTSAAILRTVPRGKQLSVVQRSGSWVQVGEVSKPIGWIHGDLLGAKPP